MPRNTSTKSVMSKLGLFSLWLGLILLVVGCTTAATPSPAPPTATPVPPKALKVGLMTDKTGALAIYGPPQTQGFKPGLEYATNGTLQVAGRRIEVIEKDDGSVPDKAVAQARELIETERVEILVGTISSDATLAVQNVVKEAKIIHIVDVSRSPDITGKNFNRYTFRTGFTTTQASVATRELLVALIKAGTIDPAKMTMVRLAQDYAFGRAGACDAYAVRKQLGLKSAVNDNEKDCGAIYAPLETTDFRPYLKQALDSGAKIFTPAWAGGGLVPLLQQMKELGIYDKMVVLTGIPELSIVKNESAKAAYAGAAGSPGSTMYHFALPKNPINDWLVKRHIEKYGGPPDVFTHAGMMAAILLVEGLKQTNGVTDPEKLIPVFEGATFNGPIGLFTIRAADHVALQSHYLARLGNINDPDLKFVELVKEFSPQETAPPCVIPAQLGRCP